MAEFTNVRIFPCGPFETVETLIKRPSVGRINDSMSGLTESISTGRAMNWRTAGCKQIQHK